MLPLEKRIAAETDSMDVLQIAYVSLLCVGLISSRLSLVGMQRGVHHFNMIIGLIGLIATFATLTLIVWGFAFLPWYLPGGAVLTGSCIANFIVTNANFHDWYAVSPIPDLITIFGSVHIWVWYWPF